MLCKWFKKLYAIEEIAQLVIDSLDEHPEEWAFTKYRLVHKSGVEIWTANEDYGISIDNYRPDHISRVAVYKLYRKLLKRDIANRLGMKVL